MNPEEFIKFLNQKSKAVENYARNKFPRKAGEISLRFIDKNFQDQGWHGQTFQPWQPIKRKGTILVKTGTLRRGNYFTVEGISAHVKNNVKYAAAHNNGFNGIVKVRAHTRRIISATKHPTGRTYKGGKRQMQTIHGIEKNIFVKSFERNVNLPRRQFFPNSWDDSPVLVKQLQTQIFNDLKTIVK